MFFFFRLPGVVGFAVGLAVAHKASAALVQEEATLDAFETLGVPFKVGRYFQNVLVVDLTTTAEAYRDGFFFKIQQIKLAHVV